MLDLSIIIINWNTRALLLQCLRSVYDTTQHLAFEVIVVDNASTDDSVAQVQANFPQVRLIQNSENLGFARANNQAITTAMGRYILLLNSDTIVRADAFIKMVQFADAQTDAGIVGSKLLNQDGSLQESWASFPTLASELLGRNFRTQRQLPEKPTAYDVDWVGGACFMVRAETLKPVGVFDENFFMYSEEADWCYRMKRQGWKVYYLTDAEVVHLGGGSAARASFMQLARLYGSKILFFKKHYGMTQAIILRYGLALVNLLGVMRRILISLGSANQRERVRQRLQAQTQLVRWLLGHSVDELSHSLNMQ